MPKLSPAGSGANNGNKKAPPKYASIPNDNDNNHDGGDDYDNDKDSRNENFHDEENVPQQQKSNSKAVKSRAQKAKEKKRKDLLQLRDAMDSMPTQAMNYEQPNDDTADSAVMGAWCGVIVILGLAVVGMFLYWNNAKSNHAAAAAGNGLDPGSGGITASRTRPPRPILHDDDDSDSSDDDDDDDDRFVSKKEVAAAAEKNHQKGVFYFDPFAAVQTSNPLDLANTTISDYYARTLVPPVWNPQQQQDDGDGAGVDSSSSGDSNSDGLGYMTNPNIVNQTVAFVSEGDLYVSVWDSPTPPPTSTSLPAMKLTTTTGNVRQPKINPVYPYLIAYTATYTGRRDVYILDLRRQTHGSQPALRLTYWPTSVGVRGLVGWKDDGTTLVFQALSDAVSLPDSRMYELTLAMTAADTDTPDAQTTSTSNAIQHPQVLQTNPVPLAQALEGAYHGHEDCWYFTRFQQSSNTARYQGGTAESIWGWCKDHQLAVPLTTHQFNGTSKAPSLFSFYTKEEKKYHYLLFLSDRGANVGDNPDDPNEWKPTTMNLWAMPLPEKDELASFSPLASANTAVPLVVSSFNPEQFVQLTQVSCDFGGMALREYSLDPVTQHIVLRIGADLHWMSEETIQEKLEQSLTRHSWEKERILAGKDNTTSAPETSAPESAAPDAKPVTTSPVATADNKNDIQKLGISVYSDFHEHHERMIPLDIPSDMTSGDVYETAYGSLAFLMTARGQAWVAPVVAAPSDATFTGAGRNMPQRRYRIAPGSQMGGSVRVLASRHVPLLIEDQTFSRRVAVILATDPNSPTAEHAFYLIETQSDASPAFLSFDDLPEPFLGGHKGGGSVKNGGLGSVVSSSMRVSPCGRRLHWVDTDGRICVMTLPMYKERESEYSDYTVLPKENEQGEPLMGAEAELLWSPGGRYLAVEHNARNQFTIISIVDCGDPLMVGSDTTDETTDPKAAGIKIGRIVQATPDRFNSYTPYWGISSFDHTYSSKSEELADLYSDDPEEAAATTTLYFLTDRDIVNKQRSPWGTRAPNPYFEHTAVIYALPLILQQHVHDTMSGHFSGGGAMELYAEQILDRNSLMKEKEKERSLSTAPSQAPFISKPEDHFPRDPAIEFGPSSDLTFARTAYLMANIPESTYSKILSQAKDDGSLLLIEKRDHAYYAKIALVADFPSDKVEMKDVELKLDDYGVSTSRDHVFISSTGDIQVIPNTVAGFKSLLSIDPAEKEDVVQTKGLAASVWPALEYQHLYGDAWRMLRDYFYDPEMTGIDWNQVFDRFLPLVRRCAKREELDDVLVQMASEVSALHVFVYGGEYNRPLLNDPEVQDAHTPASFGISVQRSAEWRGYVITSLPELDPDFGIVDEVGIYSPLSHRTLRMSGQKGLKVGDVIVAVNGESVLSVPDIYVLLRGLAEESVRLDVLRVADSKDVAKNLKAEPVLAVPVDGPGELLYSAWEWKTKQSAKALAEKAGFSVGYVHLRSMGKIDSDAFYRHFFPDYDKDALIVDVRHNRGGNIDWWLLDVLQRKAWMYWTERSSNATTGGLGWDEQFAFRGHIIVLIDEKTSSDGEGFSRGMSELGLGRLIGMRTWGGGIWLSSDNRLVDGGIATAPEDGTYNEKYGAGLGIEQMGVIPDIEVDNNPRTSYEGVDTQLEHAIEVLKDWLQEEPVVVPTAPSKRNMAYDDAESCKAKR